MKQFKTIDFYTSVGLITGFTILTAFEGDGYFNDTLLTGLLITGAWQSISMLVHTFTGAFTRNQLRATHQIASLIALVTLPLGSFYLLPIIAPFMAIFYTWLCYDETFHRMRRPLSYIK